MDNLIIEPGLREKQKTKIPDMCTIFIRKDRGFICYGGFKIGKILIGGLSRIFNKSDNEIKVIILESIQNNKHIPMGVYTKDIAETKCQQANDIFNPDISCVEISFFLV
jgi:hypothetical protein